MDIKSYKFFKDLIAKPYVEAIWLFGSRAKDTHQARADIDLAILCPTANIQQWYDLLEITENSDTLLVIDLVRLDELAANSSLKSAILSEGVKLYEQ